MANANFTCTLNAWRSGQTLYANMTYSRSGSYYYYDSSFPNPTMNLGGVTYTDTDFGNRVRAGVYVGSVTSTTFSRTVGGSGDRTVTWTAGSGTRSDFAGSWSKTVNFPVTYTAPNTPTISAAPASYNPSQAIEVTWGTTSFGNPSTGTVYLYGGTSSTPTTQLLTKTTTGNSSFVHNEPLVGNTNYYYRSRAYNGQLWSSYSAVASTTTYPAAPTITVNSIDYKNVTLAIASPSQGSALPMEIFYTVDGGTAISAGTITPGNSNTINLTFSPNTTHTVNAYIQTTAGASSVATVTFKTELPFYGSVNGQTKEITKLYGSVNGQTKLVDHLYGSVPVNHLDSVTGTVVAGGAGNITAFDGDAFYTAASSNMDLTKEVDHLELVVSTASPVETEPSDSSLLTINVYYSDSTYRRLARGTFSNIAPTYGLTGSVVAYGTDVITLTGSYSTVYVSKLIF